MKISRCSFFTKKPFGYIETALRFVQAPIKCFIQHGEYWAYGRFDEKERYAVIVNNTQDTVNVAVPVWQIGVTDGSRMEQQLMSSWQQSFTKVPDIYVVTDGYLMIAMPKTSAVILKDIG